MPFERHYLSQLAERLREKRRFIQVLAGPRQVGKTTLVNQLLSRLTVPAHYAAADAVMETGSIWIEQQWEIARLKFHQADSPEVVLAIDEIQKVPNWSETVKTPVG